MNQLAEIFEKQQDLFERFSPIEIEKGLGYGIVAGTTFDLNCPTWQAMFKEQAWRITEEVGECIDAYLEKSLADAQEEAIDVLHFVVELCIKAEFIIPNEVSGTLEQHCKNSEHPEVFEYVLRDFARTLAMTMNLLKNKPWKQSVKLTDRSEFENGLYCIFLGSLSLCQSLQMSPLDIYNGYVNKAAKNVVRQESGE